MKATIKNMRDVSPGDFASEEVYRTLLHIEEEGWAVEITGTAIDNGAHESNYYEVTLPDGEEVSGLSGYHLEPLEKLNPFTVLLMTGDNSTYPFLSVYVEAKDPRDAADIALRQERIGCNVDGVAAIYSGRHENHMTEDLAEEINK